jgi:uncharacterized protein YbjT (DUF2867 family)
MNLVVGATGILGSEICRRLVAQGKPVRGLVRHTSDQEKIADLQEMGVTLVYGDLKDRTSLDAACQGVTSVISTAATTTSRQPDDSIEATDRVGQLALVEAARAAGVHHFVYISISGNMDRNQNSFPFALAKRMVERAVQESGMIYTVLRPSYFMEIWLSPMLGFDYPNANATIYGAGHNKISWISLGDVAEFAVQSLENPAAHNAVIELGGSEPLSPLEVVALFEKTSGRPFTVTHVPEEALEEQRQAATDSLQKSFAGLMVAFAAGDPIDMSKTLKDFPVMLASVEEYATRVLEPM